MDLNLQPLSLTCFVSGQPFAEDDRVASFLVRKTPSEVARYDLLETQGGAFSPEGFIVCRWVHVHKMRTRAENSERTLKLTADTLFLTLADPSTELSVENERLVQFLALMLERKRLLRPRGRSADGSKLVYEHAKTKLLYEVPAGELNPEFFIAIQEQLSMLVGPPKNPTVSAPASETIAPTV